MKTGMFKSLASVLLACVVATPAAAGDELLRGIIGLGGAVILNEMQKNNTRNAAPRQGGSYTGQNAAASKAAEARELRKEVQRRLNALGFDAGYPDGVYGPRTRRAMADFQRSIGRTPDGKISAEEIEILYAQTNGFGGNGGGAPTGPVPPALAGSGGGAGVPKPAFPSLAGSGEAQPAATGQAGGFPALGSGGGNGAAAQNGGGFPQLGASGAGQAGQSSAFPQLGSAQAGAPAQGAFPAIGQPQQSGQTAFPGVAAAPQAGAPQMPGLANAPAPAGESMPALAAPGAVASAADDLPVDFTAELAKTAYATADAQPLISGVTLASTNEELQQAVAANGFSGCQHADGRFACSRKADTLTEDIRAWTRDGAVWAVQRDIVFKTPVPRNVIVGQLSGAYEHLVSGEGVISSGAYCNIGDYNNASLAAMFNGRPASAEPAPEAFTQGALRQALDLARLCPLAYRLDIEGENGAVSAIRMTFFDGTDVNRDYVDARLRAEEKAKALEEKVSNDLKL